MDRFWAGEMLRHTRILAGLEQQDVALKMGVTRGAVSQWESGRTVPKLEQLSKLARLYDVPLETLLSEMGYSVGRVALTLREWYARKSQNSAADNDDNAAESEVLSHDPATGADTSTLYAYMKAGSGAAA